LESIVETRDTITEAACATILERGVASLTVADVGRRAKVSTALVHYHFASKDRLLGAACERLVGRRSEARIRALGAAPGLGALDALWSTVTSGPSAEVERAWHDLNLLARHDPSVRRALAARRREEIEAFTAALPRLLTDLGAAIPLPADEAATAVLLFLDGVVLAVDQGVPLADVRTAYDAFWLVLVTGGQARGR
jgi:AcrR family transcriptional regulator